MLRSICERIGLAEEHIEILESIDRNLQFIADLVMADVFIDCFHEDGSKAVVAAQARPSNDLSLYDRIIVGEAVLSEKEPAVFAARNSGISIRDIRATTQEDKIVKQNIVPVTDDGDNVIGVLICEYDISKSVQQDRKFKQLAETVEQLTHGGSELDRSNVQEKEIHHRVKNNLQMVASILNIQARKVESQELKDALKENVNRILSIAATHDLLTYHSEDSCLWIRRIIDKVVKNVFACSADMDKAIDVRILGDDVLVDADKAVSIAIIINELVTNALKHAFADRCEGQIEITVGKGNCYVFVTVRDNGQGFGSQIPADGHFGLGLVRMMVDDKLQGSLQIHSTADGTQITFDFENDL